MTDPTIRLALPLIAVGTIGIGVMMYAIGPTTFLAGYTLLMAILLVIAMRYE